ncbi:MAG: DUF3795 domain-containing protein [bacterium]
MDFKTIVANCGLTCKSCPIYWATRETDKEKQKLMRIKIAEYCNQEYDTDLKYKNINDCNGCRTETGILFTGCYNCEIRACAQEKDLETCAQCSDYTCNKLKKLYKTNSAGKIWLDIIKRLG